MTAELEADALRKMTQDRDRWVARVKRLEARLDVIRRAAGGDVGDVGDVSPRRAHSGPKAGDRVRLIKATVWGSDPPEVFGVGALGTLTWVEKGGSGCSVRFDRGDQHAGYLGALALYDLVPNEIETELRELEDGTPEGVPDWVNCATSDAEHLAKCRGCCAEGVCSQPPACDGCCVCGAELDEGPTTEQRVAELREVDVYTTAPEGEASPTTNQRVAAGEIAVVLAAREIGERF